MKETTRQVEGSLKASDTTHPAPTVRELSRAALRPDVGAAMTIEQLHRGVYPPTNLSELIRELNQQIEKCNAGDLRRPEALLLAQATTLDVMFQTLIRRALLQEQLPQFEAFARLALRAQSQARATVVALTDIRSPRSIAFVAQANVGGNVQVNNGALPPAQAERQYRQNELLESHDGERLDAGAAGAASAGDPTMETVDAIPRAEKRRR